MRIKRFIPVRTLLLAFAILPLWATAAHATTYYVNVATGNDANNGTSSGTPFKWITKATGSGIVTGVAVSGDTIYVAPGTYPWASPPC